MLSVSPTQSIVEIFMYYYCYVLYDITYNNGETISRSRVRYNREAAAVELELSETMEVQEQWGNSGGIAIVEVV